MRRAGRIVARALLGGIVAAIVLPLCVVSALQLRGVRALARDQLLAAVRGSLKGEMYVDDLRWPQLGRIELAGVSLRDRHGVRVASLPSLAIDLSLSALLSGRVEIERLDVDHLYIDLADLGADSGLLSVFASDEPAKPPDASDLSPVSVAIRSLCLSQAQVRVRPDPERQLDLHRIHACVQFRLARSLELTLRELRAELARDREPVLSLEPAERLPALATRSAADSSAARAMRAALGGTLRFRNSADMAFDVRVAARDFSARTLEALALKPDPLRAAVDADAHVHAAQGRIEYRVQLQAADSAAELSGELSAQRVLWAHLVSERLALAKLTTLELAPLGFELDARIDLAVGDRVSAQLDLVRGFYDRLPLPEVSMHAERSADGRLSVRTLEARYAAAVLAGSAELRPDGTLAGRAKLAIEQLASLEPAQLFVPGIGGALAVDMQFSRDAHALVDASAKLDATQLELAGQRAEHVSLHANARGKFARPRLNAQLQASQLLIGGERAQQARLVIAGGPDRYTVTANVDERALDLRGWAASVGSGWDAGLQLSSELARTPITLNAPLLRFAPPDRVEVHQLRAHVLDAAFFADGLVGLGERASRLRYAATIPNLAELTRTLSSSEVPGRIELSGSVRGELARPALEAQLVYSHGVKLGQHESRVELAAQADLARALGQVQLDARAGSAHAAVRLDSRWKRSAPLAAALVAAQHQLDVRVQDVSLAELLAPADPDRRAPVTGVVAGHLTMLGNQDQFRIETQLATRLRAFRDPASVDVLFTGTYADAKLRTQLKAADRRGQLLNVEVLNELAVEALLQHPPSGSELVSASRWQAHAEIARRPLRELPVVSGLGLDPLFAPLSVASAMHIEHEPGAEPTGELQTTLSWEPDPALQVDAGAACSQLARASFEVSGQLANGSLALLIEGGPGSERVATIETGVHAKLSELLTGKTTDLGPLKLNALVKDLELSRMPIVCERGSGLVSGNVAATDLFHPRAAVKLAFDARQLRWDSSPALSVAANGHAEGDALLVDARLGSGTGSMRVNGRLPIGFRAPDPARCLNRQGALSLQTRLEHISVASLLAYVPGVARESGYVDGTVAVSGTWQQPSAKGELKLDDVSFTLPRLGQRFSHLQLRASLDGHRLRLQDGKVRDLDGSASLAAQLTLDGPEAWSAELNVNARNFPLRKSGVIMGRADADAKLVAKTTPENTDVSVQLKNVAVRLTAADFGQVQSLEPHPEIVFADAQAQPEAEPHEQPPEKVETPGPPTIIRIVTSEPMWVRRDDFSVQMLADLKVALRQPAPELTGKIELRRGFISLLGKSFEIKHGRVLLTGGANVDPQLEITATNTTPGGTVIRLEVTGFVHAPQLAFFVNEQTATAGEALTAMSGRNEASDSNASASLEKNVTSAAIGMTTGLLSLGARREFGDWLPMLSIETGEQKRVRFGVEADRLIPSFLRGFVRGAYVEGIVASGDNSGGKAGQATTSSSSGGAAASGGGVLLELLLPSDFVWAGQYGPGASWSVDMDWRP